MMWGWIPMRQISRGASQELGCGQHVYQAQMMQGILIGEHGRNLLVFQDADVTGLLPEIYRVDKKDLVAAFDVRQQVQACGAPIHDFETGGRKVARLYGPNGVDPNAFVPKQEVAETN